jgi:hypothetical protein
MAVRRLIRGVPVRLGYSISTSLFLSWPVHLLGGSPIGQEMATRYNRVFVPDGSVRYAKNRFWPMLKEADGEKWGDKLNGCYLYR